jgi:molybdenum cofactor cytidylyltransferase
MIAAVVLAAGQSSRMGRHKLLLPLRGKPLLLHVVDAALTAEVGTVLVVVGHNAATIQSLLAGYPVQLVENPDYAQGQSTSLHAGLAALGPEVEAAIFLLGDQPLVPAALLNRLMETYRAGQVDAVIPVYAGQRGNPVLFSRALFPRLLAVTGDRGGREALMAAQQSGRAATVAVDDVTINRDVDTWEEYQQITAEIDDA